MSDSREAYLKWRLSRGIRVSSDPIPATELWDAGWQAAQAQAGEAVAWMYEHDGMMHDKDHQPVFTTHRWDFVNEPYTETPLYTAPPAAAIEASYGEPAKPEGHGR